MRVCVFENKRTTESTILRIFVDLENVYYLRGGRKLWKRDNILTTHITFGVVSRCARLPCVSRVVDTMDPCEATDTSEKKMRL